MKKGENLLNKKNERKLKKKPKPTDIITDINTDIINLDNTDGFYSNY